MRTRVPFEKVSKVIGRTGSSQLKLFFDQIGWHPRSTEDQMDYGIDISVSTAAAEKVYGHTFVGQIKSTRAISWKKDCKKSISLKVSTLNYILNSTLPAFIFLVDTQKNEIFWGNIAEAKIRKKNSSFATLQVKKQDRIDQTIDSFTLQMLRWSKINSIDNPIKELPNFHRQYTYFKKFIYRDFLDAFHRTDEMQERFISDLYQHVIRLWVYLGAPNEIIPFFMWEDRNEGLWVADEGFCNAVFDELVAYLEIKYFRALDRLKQRLKTASFENFEIEAGEYLNFLSNWSEYKRYKPLCCPGSFVTVGGII